MSRVYRAKPKTNKNKCELKEKQNKRNMPGPGFEPGLLRPQRRVLTTRRSRRATEEVEELER